MCIRFCKYFQYADKIFRGEYQVCDGICVAQHCNSTMFHSKVYNIRHSPEFTFNLCRFISSSSFLRRKILWSHNKYYKIFFAQFIVLCKHIPNEEKSRFSKNKIKRKTMSEDYVFVIRFIWYFLPKPSCISLETCLFVV